MNAPESSHHPQKDPAERTRRDDADFTTHRGGAVLGDLHGPAFTHVAPVSMPMPVLIAVPHAGRVYPAEVLATMRDVEVSQLRLEDRFVDKLGVEIANATGTGLMVAHAPRAMLDLNRAEEDIDWDMVAGRAPGTAHPAKTQRNHRARNGLGLIPRRLTGTGEIWREKLSPIELQRRIERIHRPYHEYLGRQLAKIHDVWGAAILIDLHSMPPLRRQTGFDEPPKIVLGDRFGTTSHGQIMARAFRYLDHIGINAAHNRPYSGGYVLDRHGKPSKGIFAVQIEVCRSLYLDDALAQVSPALKQVAEMLSGLVRELGAQTARLGSDGQLPQAAE